MLQFNNVLCPIDFSEVSVRALAYAASLARWYDAHLEVLHVVPAFEEHGSNAQHVLRAATCPVLTGRP